jgi:hypothetical protein
LGVSGAGAGQIVTFQFNDDGVFTYTDRGVVAQIDIDEARVYSNLTTGSLTGSCSTSAVLST